MANDLTERDSSKTLPALSAIAHKETYPEPRLTDNALRVLEARYLKKDESGNVTETPRDLFFRVAKAIAAVETLYASNEALTASIQREFYDLMASGRFMPNSPTLMNAGREMGMLSACFVLPVPDSIDGIFDSIKHTALIQKAGGGTGFAFDELRPTGDFIKSSGGTTSGPISFWRAFSEATNAIQQGAFRRGANMGMMYIHHPDVLKFLHAKQDLSQFTNYNISVKITDEWMEGLRSSPDSPHIVRNPVRHPRGRREFYLPKDLEVWKYEISSLISIDQAELDESVPGRLKDGREVYLKSDIWKLIVEHAWQTGEPGVAFIDRINEQNPTPHVGKIEATNPCGEQPLLPYEACNLGSVNLSAFVTNPCGEEADVDWDGLRKTIHASTRFLDNVVEANRYPLPQIDEMCKANRKIGLGIMGFADALFQLGVAYNSEQGLEWGERFMRFVNDEAHNCSEELANERGSFPNWTNSTWDTNYGRKQRNACSTTVAPTGTISIIAGCSGGIEPMFNLAFYRNVLRERKDASPLVEVNSIFSEVAKERGFYSDQLMDRIATDGALAHIPDVPDDVKRIFVCARDISPEWHMRMQAAFQVHCDSSISKTINFPQEASEQDVDTIYRLAYELRCKGVTVYRDGCRDYQPMALQAKPDEPKYSEEEVAAKIEQAIVEAKKIWSRRPLEPPQAPEILSGLRIRQVTPFGNMHVKITVDPRKESELEVFAQLGKGGDVASSDLEAICRMVSLWLRSGGKLGLVVKQLKGIGSTLQVPSRDGRITSLADGLARALQKYQRAKDMFGLRALLLGEMDLEKSKVESTQAGVPVGDEAKKSSSNGGNGHGPNLEERLGIDDDAMAPALSARTAYKVKCPECGTTLAWVEGCRKCFGCGYSAC